MDRRLARSMQLTNYFYDVNDEEEEEKEEEEACKGNEGRNERMKANDVWQE